MRYFIAPVEATDWRLPAPRFAAKLRADWPDVAVRMLDDPSNLHVLVWTIRLAQRELVGALDRTGQVVELEGDIRDCAAFARWLRAQLPTTYRLLLYDEQYTATIDVRPETTEAELIGPFVL